MDTAPSHPIRQPAHGMDMDAAQADWPAITPDEVIGILTHYPQTGTLIDVLWHSPRPFSSACVVTTSTRDVFIKRHHVGVRNKEELMEEHAFAAHLRSKGLSVGDILTTIDGASALQIGHWLYEVYWRASGIDIYRDAMSWTPFISATHAYEAGRTMARLHLAARDFSAPLRQKRRLVASFTIFASDNPIATMRQTLTTYPAIADYLGGRDWEKEVTAIHMPYYTKLQPYLRDLTPLWAHNDVHASNLLWSDDSAQAHVTSVVDFGLSNRTCALFDLGTAIERNIIEWLQVLEGHTDVVHTALLDALLAGYTDIIALTPRDLAALAALLPLVHTDFALSEVDYFQGVTHSAKNADLAYEGYFLGHTSWFDGEEGQALLQHIAHFSAVTLRP